MVAPRHPSWLIRDDCAGPPVADAVGPSAAGALPRISYAFGYASAGCRGSGVPLSFLDDGESLEVGGDLRMIWPEGGGVDLDSLGECCCGRGEITQLEAQLPEPIQPHGQLGVLRAQAPLVVGDGALQQWHGCIGMAGLGVGAG